MTTTCFRNRRFVEFISSSIHRFHQKVLALWIVGAASVLFCQHTLGQTTTAELQKEIARIQLQLDQLIEAGEDEAQDSEMPAVEEQTGKIEDDKPLTLVSELDCDLCDSLQPDKPKEYPTARLTGFFQAEIGWFGQDAGNRSAVGDIQDGADLRRARLAATGNVAENVRYIVEFDFGLFDRLTAMDVWLQMEDVADGDVRIGQFRHPFGMDGQTSVKQVTFLERSLPFALLPFRQIGGMYRRNSEDELSTWSISGFRFPTNQFGGNVGDNGGFGMATRWTGLLIDDGDNGVVHIGGGYSFGDPANDQERYRSQPEFFVGATDGAVPAFVDTDVINTNHFSLLNAELGMSRNAFHVQGELFYALINQIGGPDLSFPSGYVQAGYILTGEHRSYNRKNGVFGGVTPNQPFSRCGGLGAWEIAGRWSHLDLNDENIQGGRLNDLTLGLNWYLNEYTKFQFNYIHAFLGESPSVYGPVVSDTDADIVAMRAQVSF